jgi:hypothetical protein
VSDPEVPTLADAAQAIVDWWDKQGTVGEPWQKIERLRAALGQREPARQMIDEVTAEHASTWEPHGRGFAVDGTSLAGQREPDTPASVSAANKATPYGEWSQLYDSFGVCPHDVFRTEPCGECPPRSHPCDRVPAIPEGGELDDLLRRADYWGQQVPRIGPTTADVFDVMARLASALRSQRVSAAELMAQRDYLADRLSQRFADTHRLERELAEVRDTPSPDLAVMRSAYRRGDWSELERHLGWRQPEGETVEVNDLLRSAKDEARRVRAAEDKEAPNG